MAYGESALPTSLPTRDSVLLESVAAGEKQALAELFARHHATLYALAFGILSDPAEAEEIVGSTFREVQWEARHFSPSHYPVSRWLADLTRTAAAERLRARMSELTRPTIDPTLDATIEGSI